MSKTRFPPRLRRVEPVLRRALRGPCAVPAGATLLVAVSGGADSTALLVGLHSIAAEFGLSLHAAHLHHGLRAAAADADLEAVRGLCLRLGMPLTSARRDARRVMSERGWSGEDGLRRIRRRFLARVARNTGAAAIATAHSADDQLETLLLRLARGAGLRGMGGMRERSGGWIKPLLEATRSDIEHDLRSAGITWREDETNASRLYARNRIRHDVIPALLEAVAPDSPTSVRTSRHGSESAAGAGVWRGTRGSGRGSTTASAAPDARAGLVRRAARAAAELRGAEDALTAWVRRRLSRISRIERGDVWLDSRGLAPYPSAARRIALRLLWSRLDGAREALTQRHLDALMTLIESGGPQSEVRLPGGYRAIRENHVVRIVPGASRRTGAPSTECMARHKAHGGPTES